MNYHKSCGITLVELMISMTLGLMLTGGCLQIFITVKQCLLTQQAMSRIQENARIASLLLGEAIRSSGNLGCNAFREDISLRIHEDIDPQNYGLNINQRAVGIGLDELAENTNMPKSALHRLIPGNDILWLKSVKGHFPLAQRTAGGEVDHLMIKGQPHLKENEIIALSDCSHADILRVKKIQALSSKRLSKISVAQDNKTIILSKQYDNAEVGVVSSRLFYVGNTYRHNANNHPVYSLYSTDLNGRTMELIEGVEKFSILYGLKNESSMSYLPFDKVVDWEKVCRVKILLLLTSIENGLVKPQSYSINNNLILPSDKLMRMWWTYEWTIKGLTSMY